jgi:predicted ATPase
MMAKGPYHKTISELTSMYQNDLGTQSHGESYLDFFKSRIKPDSVYLLDEPETPLSFQNQLALLALIMDATKKGCQFIIATHSPILAAFKDALIYEIKSNQFQKTSYEHVESIKLLKEFLNHKDHFLYHLEQD